MAELQRRGIPFVADDEGMIRQLGPSRRARGDETRLFIRDGNAVEHAPFASRQTVLVEGLEAPEQAELDELTATVTEHLSSLGRVPLNERGIAALERGDLSGSGERPVPGLAPDQLVATDDLITMVQEDMLDLDAAWLDRFERWAELRSRFSNERVALFLEPDDGAAS
jgi:hypothetical protein